MRIVYKSDNGLTIEIGGTSFYKLKRRIFDSVSTSAQTVKPTMFDGAITENLVLEQRNISIEGIFVAAIKENFMDHQNTLYAVFNPKFVGMLYCYYNDKAVQIRCRTLATPDMQEQTKRSCVFSVELLSDDAYWESAEMYYTSIGILESLLTFPRSVGLEGLPYGRTNIMGVINNITTINIPPIIEVFSTTDTFIKVENLTTSEYFIIDQTIEPSQKMIIDVKHRQASIWEMQIDGAFHFVKNVLNYLTTDSTLWELVPGLNEIKITTGNPDDTSEAIISYRLKFGGV